MYALIPAEVDFGPVTSAISEIAGALPAVITAALGVSILVFGASFVWRKAKSIMGS